MIDRVREAVEDVAQDFDTWGRSAAQTEVDPWQQIESLAFEHGRAFDSYYMIEPNWKRFWAGDRSGFVGYRRMGRYLKAVGGLLAPEEVKPRLLSDFCAFTDRYRLIATLMNVTEADLPLVREYGFDVSKWGEEAVIDLPACTWSGGAYEWVRRQRNFCRRSGVVVVERHPDDLDPREWGELRAELAEVAAESLIDKPQSGEMELQEPLLDPPQWGRRRLFAAYADGGRGRLEGFLVALPGRDGVRYTFDLYRHRADAVRGVVPYLFCEAVARLRDEGVESVSLSLLPGHGCDGSGEYDSPWVKHGLRFSGRYLSFIFDLNGLYHFKSRFRPRYEPRYLCVRPGSSFFTMATTIWMTGILRLDARKTARLLLRHRRKRAERASLAGFDK